MDVSPPVGRSYRTSLFFRMFAIAFLVLSSAFAVGLLCKAAADPDSLTWVNMVVAVLFPIVGMFLTGKAFSSTLIFSEDRLTMRSVLNVRSLEYVHIRGRREYVLQDGHGSTRYLRLETTDGSKPFDFGKRMYRYDDAFWGWYHSLPDMDAADKVGGKGSNFGLV